jgi:hypothetical protein
MRRIQPIIGKILLIVMVSFFVHDYMVGQQDILHQNEEVCAMMQKDRPALHKVAVEHHIFHVPALVSFERIMTADEMIVTPEFPEDLLLSYHLSNPPFTPPKHS